jgi:hypothetical protein
MPEGGRWLLANHNHKQPRRQFMLPGVVTLTLWNGLTAGNDPEPLFALLANLLAGGNQRLRLGVDAHAFADF